MSLFQSSLMLYIPLSIVIVFSVLFIPSLLVSGSRPEGVARAISCYMMMTFGIILVALSAIQMTYSLMNLRVPELPNLYALILLFSLGIGILVFQSTKAALVDEASVMVPRLIFSHACEIVGYLIAIVSALSIVITFLVNQNFAGWQMSGTMLVLSTAMMYLSSKNIEMKNKKGGRVMKKKK